ncbi:hypothetical protein J6590_028630 [Homalodisca vitripennis]|nr:hypothetical protein J6590_028630 [Homalodisca vitripennis]
MISSGAERECGWTGGVVSCQPVGQTLYSHFHLFRLALRGVSEEAKKSLGGPDTWCVQCYVTTQSLRPSWYYSVVQDIYGTFTMFA